MKLLAQYLHATSFSPPLSTLERAVKNGNFITWPGIDDLNFKKLLGTTVALEKGHLDQERKGVQSTSTSIDDDNFPLRSSGK